MAKEILYKIAEDERGEIITVDRAEKGNKYFCPECKSEFSLHKSGKTGKGSRRPHFQHLNQDRNCNPESILHKSFKKLLVSMLRNKKATNESLFVNWACTECKTDYSGNSMNRDLLKEVAAVREEYNLRTCQPDIALLNQEDEVIGVIEIAVTHHPEEQALNYYKENGITLIQINLSSEDDLNRIEERITYPDIVNYCINPKCQKLENHRPKRKLGVAVYSCRYCRSELTFFQLIQGSVFDNEILNALTDHEIEQLNSINASIKIKVDPSTRVKHVRNHCATCQLRRNALRNRYIKSRF
jgi:hypothetical protein